MNNEFNQEIDRRNTSAIKWEIIQDRNNPELWIKTDGYFGKDRILPMWVADTDFAVAPEIQQALHQRAEHPVFG